MIRIFIVDDQFIIREGIKTILSEISDIKIIGEAENGESALQQIGVLQPDVVLLDINLPGIDGFHVAEKITDEFPKVKTIIFSSDEQESCVKKAVSLGAKGYLSKSAFTEELEWAIELVHKGYSVIKPELLKQNSLTTSYSNSKSPSARVSDRNSNSKPSDSVRLPQKPSAKPNSEKIKTNLYVSDPARVSDRNSNSKPSDSVGLPQKPSAKPNPQINTGLYVTENLLAKNHIQRKYARYKRRRARNRLFYNIDLVKLKKTITSFEFILLVLIVVFSLSFLTMVALP